MYKPYKCKWCGQSFRQDSTMKLHERVHFYVQGMLGECEYFKLFNTFWMNFRKKNFSCATTCSSNVESLRNRSTIVDVRLGTPRPTQLMSSLSLNSRLCSACDHSSVFVLKIVVNVKIVRLRKHFISISISCASISVLDRVSSSVQVN